MTKLEILEAAFIVCGQQGANADVHHPLRKCWVALRDALAVLNEADAEAREEAAIAEHVSRLQGVDG